ncbi:MAG TPA: hypothetical protein EYP09_01340 [Anaerolineae bacterium]|nr:hypothetical protein [Anaerolineae bacterium]
MPRIKVIVEAKEHIFLGSGLPVENIQTSRNFIAGSVLRGALARAILQPLGLWKPKEGIRGGAPQASLPEGFAEVFLAEPPARFGFLYPIWKVGENGEEPEKAETFPIPLTAFTCKAQGGFGKGGHGVYDELLSGILRTIGVETAVTRKCPKCGEPLQRMRGFAARIGDAYRRIEVHPRLQVGVGLNRLTETAEGGILYTQEALPPHQRIEKGNGQMEDRFLHFVGYWRMSSEQWKTLRKLLEDFVPTDDGGYYLRIGTARARGMGAVVIRWIEKPAPELPALEKRLEDFQPRGTDRQELDPAHWYFVLTLRSPLLIYDDYGLPTPRLTPDALNDYVTSLPKGLEFLEKASVIEREEWSGWSAVWGLPKPVVTAIAAGSVLTFRAPRGEKDAVLAFLQEVEEYGLGERRAEGWGEAVACDPFHVKFAPEVKDG